MYQVFGFLAAGLAIWAGIRRRWNDVTYTGVAAFTLLLYIKALDWWWDWMPRWLFFLVLGGIAVAVMLVLGRVKAAGRGCRMTTRGVLVAVAVLLLANGAILVNVARNRAGNPDAVVRLSQREVTPAWTTRRRVPSRC